MRQTCTPGKMHIIIGVCQENRKRAIFVKDNLIPSRKYLFSIFFGFFSTAAINFCNSKDYIIYMICFNRTQLDIFNAKEIA